MYTKEAHQVIKYSLKLIDALSLYLLDCMHYVPTT